MAKSVYLAGPMTGKPFFNFPAFFDGEDALRALGYDDIFSPAKQDIKRYGHFWTKCPNGSHAEAAAARPGDPPTYRECLKVDLNWILDHADAIALLPGWENSKGVKAEKALADCLGLEVIYL